MAKLITEECTIVGLGNGFLLWTVVHHRRIGTAHPHPSMGAGKWVDECGRVCGQEYLHARTCVCVCVCVCVFFHVHTHKCMCTYVHSSPSANRSHRPQHLSYWEEKANDENVVLVRTYTT
jgi:hypothetical protein